MAVAVPIIMSAAGASAATTLVTSLVLTATGINDKINKAATKVFGEDLVKFGNIAGAAFMAFGGPSSFGFGEGAAASGLEGVDAAMADAANSIGSAPNAGLDLSLPGSMGAAADSSLVAANTGVTGGGVLSEIGGAMTKGGKWIAEQWETMSPSTKTLLGNTAAGMAKGYMEGSAAEDERKWRDKRSRGSGLRYGTDYTYGTRPTGG